MSRWSESADSLSIFVSVGSPQRALPTETKVESGTSQSKIGTSVKLSSESGTYLNLSGTSVNLSGYPRQELGVLEKGDDLSKTRCPYRGTSLIKKR